MPGAPPVRERLHQRQSASALVVGSSPRESRRRCIRVDDRDDQPILVPFEPDRRLVSGGVADDVGDELADDELHRIDDVLEPAPFDDRLDGPLADVADLRRMRHDVVRRHPGSLMQVRTHQQQCDVIDVVGSSIKGVDYVDRHLVEIATRPDEVPGELVDALVDVARAAFDETVCI